MEAQPIALLISFVALLLAIINTMSGMRSSKSSQASSEVARLVALHQATVDTLKEDAQAMRAENRRYQQHIDTCEEELARIRDLLTRQGRFGGGEDV